ncbi:MAG: IS4 family transposase, partial [candidate division Zixibacteria bacterium]|nr:IS4 family transposase [candidate division Zixibacteria bacterium]
MKFVDELFGDELHSKRVLSMANATTGVIHAAALGVNAIGRAYALSAGKTAKHGIKQVDRLLSNKAIDPAALFSLWVPYVLGDRTEARVALDWTHFDADGHSTIAAYLITNHGRATPLVWRTFPNSELTGGGRTDAEDLLLLRLQEVVPQGVKVILLADRGFGDVGLYEMLDRWGWDYVVRFRKDILVTSAAGETKPAEEWLSPKGHSKAMRGARVTAKQYEVGAVVTVRAAGMKESWCLATSLKEASARDVVDLYARRFTIEETFRDQKDPRFGLGMRNTRVASTDRRDRLLLLASLAQALLTLLGAAGERCGLDRGLKPNTSKKRSLSLFNQGCYWFEALPNMREDRVELLMTAFGEIIREHQAIRSAL